MTLATLESRMAHIAGFERNQLLLLPEAVDDYVEADNPVRFIDAFVDGLDLTAAGFVRVEAKATGRPGYAPGDLLKLYIYGYLNRVRSSRRLEAECRRNIEVIWLLRTLKPDFKTIADFRRDNRGAFKPVFRQFVLLCGRLDLSGATCWPSMARGSRRSTTRTATSRAIRWRNSSAPPTSDWTNISSGSTRAMSRKTGMGGGARTNNLAEKIAALTEKRRRYAAMLRELERSGETQMSLTDPDSRAMAAHTKVAVGYNAQVAVDAKHKLIVEQAVTNQVVDMGLLTQTVEPASRAPRSRDDRRRRRPRLLQERGHRGLREGRLRSPRSQAAARCPSVREGLFRKDEFLYDAERDAYVRPAGKLLTPIRHGRLRDLKKIDYGNPKACRDCPLRARCTNDIRSVSRLKNEDALDRMAERSRARPRFSTVAARSSSTFGSIKQWMHQGGS